MSIVDMTLRQFGLCRRSSCLRARGRCLCASKTSNEHTHETGCSPKQRLPTRRASWVRRNGYGRVRFDIRHRGLKGRSGVIETGPCASAQGHQETDRYQVSVHRKTPEHRTWQMSSPYFGCANGPGTAGGTTGGACVALPIWPRLVREA